MNIQRLRQIIRFNNINQGSEFLFTERVKGVLPSTNFELLGEQLMVGNGIGKCDLWLANVSNNFLLSLELKVGRTYDSSRQKFLGYQVHKYTDLMKYYFPDNIVYGMGAYKCTTKHGVDTEIKFVDYVTKTVNKHSEEIENLKYKIKNGCLN